MGNKTKMGFTKQKLDANALHRLGTSLMVDVIGRREEQLATEQATHARKRSIVRILVGGNLQEVQHQWVQIDVLKLRGMIIVGAEIGTEGEE